MANQTIYGCVNLTTGVVTFAGEACDSGNYIGCINWATGQVEVTISEVSCDDTYYGCINFATGQFQLIIPDDCCGITCPDCGGFEVEFSDVIDCEYCFGGWPSDINTVGPFILNYNFFSKGGHWFCGGSNGWTIQIYCNEAVFRITAQFEGTDEISENCAEAFGNVFFATDSTVPTSMSNRFVASGGSLGFNCGNQVTSGSTSACDEDSFGFVDGYGGTVSLTYSTTGC